MIERVWMGEGVAASAARVALWPLAAAFGAAAGARRALYDAGVLTAHEPALPCVSVGNLTAGGTGKTPFASALAALLRERIPTAIVLRGYGGDEAEVHRRLTPGVTVIQGADRLAAAEQAKAAGARLVVLDDAFQHRRIARVADIVLVSVEQVMRPRRLLPAGPWREPLEAASRASLVVLTRKSATRDDASAAARMVADAAPDVPITTVHLSGSGLGKLDSKDSRPVSVLSGADVLAVSAIGEPDAFRKQLEQLGARVTPVTFRDHHAYSAHDARRIAEMGPSGALVVCTLKDAVKLAASWPGPRTLWYLSQQLTVEQGAEHLNNLCARVVQRAGSTAAG